MSIDPYDIDAMKNAIHEAIEASPVVGTCECGNEIRKAEITFGMATDDTCVGCVLAYVADQFDL